MKFPYQYETYRYEFFPVTPARNFRTNTNRYESYLYEFIPVAVLERHDRVPVRLSYLYEILHVNPPLVLHDGILMSVVSIDPFNKN